MGLRYGTFFRIPRLIFKNILSLLYPIIIRIWPLPKVKSITETIEKIVKDNCSIIRFGDGEILYITDKLELPFQEYKQELANKLKLILKSDIPNILVGLPNDYIKRPLTETSLFWRSQITWSYPRFRRHLNLSKEYYNASITRIYYGSKDIEKSKEYFQFMKQIWNDRDVLLIEGEKSRFGVGNDLLNNARSIIRILGPYHHAFRKYEELLEAAGRHNKNKLILVALGPAAKPLAFELAVRGFQVVDIGNLDIEYEWFRLGVKERVKIKGKYTSEALGGRVVEDIRDTIYESQIIERIV